MRKIEEQMNQALRSFSNWSSGNTTVTSTKEEMRVHLHGNHIATLNKATMELNLFDGGWQSNTTKSRLNAFLDEVAYGVSVFQKNWQWFLHDRRTTATIDFYDNMVVFSKPLTLSDV